MFISLESLPNSSKNKMSSIVGQSFWKSNIQVLERLDRLVVLKLQWPPESPGELIKTQIAGSLL